MSDKRELTRAEIARQRRAQRSVQELQQTGLRAVKPIQSAVTRRAMPEAPKPTFVEVEKKRRFSIALGLPEFHLRRPTTSAPNLRSGWRPVSLGIVIFTGVMIYLTLTLPYFNVPSVTVIGNSRLTREEISDALGVLGQSIFTVQPDDAAMRLQMNYPELLSVDVSVYLPNHVYATVSERQPVILWQQDSAYTWIDPVGVAFRPHGNVEGLIPVNGLATPPAGIPLSDNPLTPPPYMQKELVDAILILAPNIPADTTMVYDQTYGLGWEDTKGWKVFFGSSAHDMPLKVRVYQSLEQSLVERRLRPIFISVMHPDAPYYRMAAEVEYQPVAADNGQ